MIMQVTIRVDEETAGLLDDKKQAVEMKLFGNLTRESYEWHPHRLMCKRFNVPNPYPEYVSARCDHQSSC